MSRLVDFVAQAQANNPTGRVSRYSDRGHYMTSGPQYSEDFVDEHWLKSFRLVDRRQGCCVVNPA
jgi:hypothetical protein